MALDIPSGLVAQTGTTPGEVIHAAHTVTFIALKPGLLTGKARDVVGALHHNALGLEGGSPGRRPLSRALMRRIWRNGFLRAAPHPIRAITAGW